MLGDRVSISIRETKYISVVVYCEASFKNSFFDLKATAFKITKQTRNIQIEESLNETVSARDIFKEETN